MENIYQETIRDVEDGAKFKIDFQSRSLKLNGKYIIQDGVFEGDLGVEPSIDTDEFLSQFHFRLRCRLGRDYAV